MSREKYIEKIDEIIDYFKIEKEDWTNYYNLGKEDSKFYFNIFLSIILILVTISTILTQINDVELKSFVLYILVLLLALLIIYMISDSISSNKRMKEYIHDSVKYNTIIYFLHSLKILPYEVDLSPLINKVKQRYHLNPTHFSNQEYFTEYIMETWFEEVRKCIDAINKEIYEKDKTISLPK